MPGTELRRLQGESHIRPVRKMPHHVFCTMPHNNNPGRCAQTFCGIKYMVDHGTPGNGLKHFRKPGMHALSHACSKNDYVHLFH